MKKIKRLSGSIFALLMAVVLLAQTNVVVLAETIATVSGNEMEEVVDETEDMAEDEEADVKIPEEEEEIEKEIEEEIEEDEKSELEEEAEETALETEAVVETEAAQYLNFDAFTRTGTWKGVQGQYDGIYGQEHTLINIFIEDLVWKTDVASADFVYNGQGYCFDVSRWTGWVSHANRNNISVSAVLLLRYDPGKSFMIDPTALSNHLAGNNTKNSIYFAPNTTGEMGAFYDAFFKKMADTYSRQDCHIDNWILGNEVNMPNSWHYTGSTDPQYNADLYADAYLRLYNAVRTYTNSSRVSISVDHSWQHNDMGRGIGTKEFINRFHAAVAARQANVNWCISYHLYPAILSQPDIWVPNAHMPDAPEIDLNPKHESAQFVDGHNLSVMTNYIRDTYGSQHRIMLTEQGFSQYMGTDIQAASLAYSYYAAKYDPMVDCFIINAGNEGGKLNFSIGGTLAEQVFEKLDSDQAWVESVTLPIIGAGSYAELVPNYRAQVNKAQVEAYVTRLYELCLERPADPYGHLDWTKRLCRGSETGASAAQGFFFSDEFVNKKVSDEQYVELLYNVMMGRNSDAAGKKDWVYKLKNGVTREGVFKGFADSAEFNNICNSYGITRGTIAVAQGRDRNPGLTTFVSRLYTKALGRQYEVAGLNDWCNRILDGQWTINDVSTTGFFNSQEFINKNMSDSEYVKTLYLTFFDRAYDQAGYDDWMNQLANGVDRNTVLQGFANSSEFANLKKSFGL